MRPILSHKVRISSWAFMIAFLIQNFSPTATKEYGWLLLMVAFADASLTVTEPEELRKVNMVISTLLKLLWLFGFGYSLLK